MSLKTAVRIVHGLITIYFGICIAYIYFCVFTNTRNLLLTISLFSVWSEFLILYGFNKGQCPLFHLHEKVGDDKLFFELFLPKRLATKVIPTVSIITFSGSMLLFMQIIGFV